MDFLLEQFGVISLKNIFIDGTKIESFSNKYKLVWKKTVLKNKAKLMEKIPAFVSKAREEFSLSLHCGGEIHLRHLKKLRRKLKVCQKAQNITFVKGTEEDNLQGRSAAAREPKHTSRGCICNDEGGYEFPPVPEPWHRECPC